MRLAVAQELVGAEAIGFDAAPGVFGAHGALILRADAVLPVVAGDEVAAGPAQDGDAEVADGFHDVLAVALGVGERTAFLVDAAVDAAAEVLGEIAEDVGMHLADDAVGVDLDACGGLRGKREGQADSEEEGADVHG